MVQLHTPKQNNLYHLYGSERKIRRVQAPRRREDLFHIALLNPIKYIGFKSYLLKKIFLRRRLRGKISPRYFQGFPSHGHFHKRQVSVGLQLLLICKKISSSNSYIFKSIKMGLKWQEDTHSRRKIKFCSELSRVYLFEGVYIWASSCYYTHYWECWFCAFIIKG